MPNTKSAAKRLRSNATRRGVNRARRSRVRTCERNFREALAQGNSEETQRLLSMCFSELDKAAKKGVIHRNAADRKKSRLVAAMRRVD
jgi:small subunit ribosomal protein S20